ncbi:MAG: TIR domain-containing protein [Chloroflexota bacterium]
MARIFVSYSRADRQFIDQFIPLIRRVYGNDSVWFDDDIHGGVVWWQMILNEVGKCDLFVYLVSNESLESPYCQAELREALRLNKAILPVIVRRLKPPYPGNIADDLAPMLRKTQYVDMAGGFRDPNTIAALYAAITRLLDAVPQQPVTPQTNTPTPEPPVPDKKKADPTLRAAYIAGGFALLAAVIAGVFGLWQGALANQNVTPDPPTTTSVAQIARTVSETSTTEMTLTATTALTETPTTTDMPEPSATPTDTPNPIPPETCEAVVINPFGVASTLPYVYPNPNPNSNRNGYTITVDEILTIITKEGARYQVERNGDTLGWVPEEYLIIPEYCQFD